MITGNAAATAALRQLPLPSANLHLPIMALIVVFLTCKFIIYINITKILGFDVKFFDRTRGMSVDVRNNAGERIYALEI